jgi:hypothetical protein
VLTIASQFPEKSAIIVEYRLIPRIDRYDRPMTITITLPPATEERLRAQAEATGKNISTLVLEAVEARLSFAHLSLRDILSPVHGDFERSGMTGAALDTLLETSLDAARSERQSAPGSSA